MLGVIDGVPGKLALPRLVFAGPLEAVGFQGGAGFLVGDFVEEDLQAVRLHVQEDFAAVKFKGVCGVVLVLLYAVQLGKVLLRPLDFAAQAGKLEVGEGGLCKGWGALDCLVHFGGGFVGEVKKVDNTAGTFTLDISAKGDGSMMVLIDKSAVYTVLQAVQAPTGETKLEEKEDTVVAMDDMEADAEAAQKKADKKSKRAKSEEQIEEVQADEQSGDSLEKTDSNTLLKD